MAEQRGRGAQGASDAGGSIRFACKACGARIKMPGNTAGRRGKCPNCHEVFTIPCANAVPAAQAELPDSESLLDELAAAESSAPSSTPTRTGAAVRCPSCGTSVSKDDVLCVSCGTNVRTGKRHQTVVIAEASATPAVSRGVEYSSDTVRSLLRGSLCSFIGAAIGAAGWIAFTVGTGYMLSLIAWALGALAGLGMYMGHHKPNTLSGLVAAGIAGGTIIVAQAMIFRIVFNPSADLLTLSAAIVRAADPLDVLFFLAAVVTAYWVGARGPGD